MPGRAESALAIVFALSAACSHSASTNDASSFDAAARDSSATPDDSAVVDAADGSTNDPTQPGTLALGAATYAATQKSGTLMIAVHRTDGSLGGVSVDYATADGTAVAGTEYTTTKGTLSWAAGETADKIIGVPIVQIVPSPKDRSFSLTLSNVMSATLGTPSMATVTLAKDPSLAIAARVATGPAYTCAINASGVVKCWGQNNEAQLGQSTTALASSTTPVVVDLGGKKATMVAAQYDGACAALEDGTVSCWGYGVAPTKATLPTGHTPVAMNGGVDFTCMLLDDDSVACGEIMNFAEVTLPHKARAVSAGYKGNCFILDDGTLTCELGTWSGQTVATPAGHKLRLVAETDAGDTPPTACFQLDDGTVDCPFTVGQTPALLSFGMGRTATMLRHSVNEQTCALLDNATARCWDGQAAVDGLGGPGQSTPTTGIDFGAGRTATAVTTGAVSGHACAFLDNGDLKCWGENTYGQLGLGDTKSRGGAAGDMGDNLPAVKL